MNNQLIATLLDYPNLSLRVLDLNGRAIKTMNQDQLRQYFNAPAPACNDLAIDKRINHLN